MKVLHFMDGMHRGGKERRLVELMKFTLANGLAEIELAVMSREMAYPEVLEMGIPVHYLVRRSHIDLLIFFRLWKLCRASRPDILHAWDSMTAVYAAVVAKWCGIKLVNGMITNAPPSIPMLGSRRTRCRLAFPLSDAIVGNSLAGLRVYGAPKEKSVCIYNGFNAARLRQVHDPGEVRRRLDIRTRSVVGMVGEFADRKDFFTFVDAARIVIEANSDVTFLAIGDGENLAECKAMVSERESERIKFPGWLGDVESVLPILDVGVLATNADIHGEGISNSVLEYMAFGKPVVATRAGGTEEIVLHGRTGYIVENKDPVELARRILTLVNDPGLARDMGIAGRTLVANEFSIDKMTSRYMALYRALLTRTHFSAGMLGPPIVESAKGGAQ